MSTSLPEDIQLMQTELFKPVPVQSSTVHARIEFDGGTSCNVPALGYGHGYGSYRINGDPIRRCNFYRPMSSNAAEVATLVQAIEEAKQKGANSLLIVGDSKIALGWARHPEKRKMSKTGSEEFRKSIGMLRRALEMVAVEIRWQPRLKSVQTFGH